RHTRFSRDWSSDVCSSDLYIDAAKNDPDVAILIGGNYDKSKGYFIEPTVLVASKPTYVTLCDELFGPVLTLFIYEDDKFEETLRSEERRVGKECRCRWATD